MTSSWPKDPCAAATMDLDAFLDLLYADEELVRAEFEAIVTAGWPRPPSRLAMVHEPPGGSGRLTHERACRCRIEPVVDHDLGVDRSARQRSPPRAASLTDVKPAAVVGPASPGAGPRHMPRRW